MLLHTRGKSPGHAVVCGKPVALRFVFMLPPTESRLGTVAEAPQARTDSLLAIWAGAHVSTHARTLRPPRAPQSPATRSAVTWAHRGAVGAGSRARADYRVREPAPPRDVRGAGAAPPARRSRLAAAAASG